MGGGGHRPGFGDEVEVVKVEGKQITIEFTNKSAEEIAAYFEEYVFLDATFRVTASGDSAGAIGPESQSSS